MSTVFLLDYVAGNVRSLANAIEKLGFQIEWIKRPEDIAQAEARLLRSYFNMNTQLSKANICTGPLTARYRN